MNELLLQHLWKNKLFNQHDLKTTSGESLEIISPGEHNTNAGPDFFNARIRCSGTILAGNIEVHLSSSDWNKHFHNKDKTYQNIILHVVFDDDEALQSVHGENFLTLELKHRISRLSLERYKDLQQLQPFIPCSRHWSHADEMTKQLWLQRMLIERLEVKCEAIEKILKETQNNWEMAFYYTLARNFGFRINALPFELLARHIPLAIFAKNKTNLFQIEAILFGVSGFLNDSRISEKYYLDLRAEYAYQKQKLKLQEIDVTLWKFLRLRPANFPEVRIAQFANLIYRSVHLFSRVVEYAEMHSIKQMLNCCATLFWDTHYTFKEVSSKGEKHLGEDACNNIMVNTMAPFLFLYGKMKMHPSLTESALNLLEQLPPENNSIIRAWKSLKTEVKNASGAQALIHLKQKYCDAKRCLECGIGIRILKDV